MYGFDDNYCYAYSESTISSSVQIVNNQRLDDIQSLMYLTEDWSQRNFTISTLVLSNISINDIGSYECFSFINVTEGSSRDLETLYQSLYLYGEGNSANLSVPIDHIYRKQEGTNNIEIPKNEFLSQFFS